MRNVMKGGFLVMVLSVLGVVLYVTMFSSVLAALETIRLYANLSTFIALETVVEIAPTVLLLGGVFGAGFAYYKGFKQAGANDPGGLMRMVLGVLVIILFATLFATILSSTYTLYGYADGAGNVSSEYTAFQTVCTIFPTVLFLMGIFAGGATAVSGYRARKRRRALR